MCGVRMTYIGILIEPVYLSEAARDDEDGGATLAYITTPGYKLTAARIVKATVPYFNQVGIR